MSWLMTIKRGATLRRPITILDRQKVPVSFNDGSLTITPDDDTFPAIQLTHLNGKFTRKTFAWKGRWDSETAYVTGDAVQHGTEYWRAVAGNTNQAPPGNLNWEVLAQFTVLISATETNGYAWDRASYDIDVTFTNGDIEKDFMTGRVQVHDV